MTGQAAAIASDLVRRRHAASLLYRRRWVDESPDGRYRYQLGAVWEDGGLLCWLLLNPSTADHVQDDPTLQRIERRSRMWGYGGLVVANLFALRSPDPRVLRTHADPVGAANDAAILDAVRLASAVIAGWGAGGDLHGRAEQVSRRLARCGRPVLCLGRTTCGAPRHPLYVPYDRELAPWP